MTSPSGTTICICSRRGYSDDAAPWSDRCRRTAPSDLDATIAVGRKTGFDVEEKALAAVPATRTLARWSVSVYEFRAT
jgi:hypothetical protein